MGPIIHNVNGSKLGNMMLKYLAATKIHKRIVGSKLSNYVMTEWNINYPHIPKGLNEVELTLAPAEREMEINFERIEFLSKMNIVDRFNMFGHVQRMENYPDLQEAQKSFLCDKKIGTDFKGCVICPVRGAEILDAIHPGYTLIPVEFYREIVDRLSLPPIFMGQIGDDPYSVALRRAFPKARFIPSAGAIPDFQTIRKAEAIILSVSTFVWLGAWLSNARIIVMPVFGLYNRSRFPNHDFLPLGDSRFEFYEFPIQDAVPLAEFERAHAGLTWRQIAARDLLRSM